MLDQKVKELKTIKIIEVRFCEVDALNVVWHGNYIKYFEDAREKFCRVYGLQYRNFIKHGYSSYMLKYEVEHKLPLKNGDKIKVEVELKNSITSKIIFIYRIFNKKNKLVCLGKTEQVIVNSEGKLMIDWPEFMKKWREKNLLK